MRNETYWAEKEASKQAKKEKHELNKTRKDVRTNLGFMQMMHQAARGGGVPGVMEDLTPRQLAHRKKKNKMAARSRRLNRHK